MAMKEEVMKSYQMLRDAGFRVEDIVFEGAMSVKNKTVLEKLQDLSEQGASYGNVRIIYSVDKEQVRNIIIPVGKAIPEVDDGPEETLGF